MPDDLAARIRAAIADWADPEAVRDSRELWKLLERVTAAHVKILDWAQQRHCGDDGGNHLLSPPSPDDLVEALADAYGIDTPADS